MAFKFEKLEVWKISLELGNKIDQIAKTFPRIELFSLTNQIKRAADSVNLNIAEGCMGQSNAEFSRFLTYSSRSSLEVVSCLFIAQKRRYISDSTFKELYNSYEQLCKMISKLRNSLK
jgi:four helix bundle protein